MKLAITLLAALSLSGIRSPYQGWAGTGASVLPAPTIVSFASSASVTDQTATVTPANIPNGAVVLAIYSGYLGPAGAPTSTHLTFTQRVATNNGGLNHTAIYTAVSGGDYSNEAISINTTTAPERAGLSVAVLTGADTSLLTQTNSTTGTGTAVSLSISGLTQKSWVFMAALDGSGATSFTPNGVTTELWDFNDSNANIHWRGRNTDAASETITVGGTMVGAGAWSASAIAISAVPATPPGFASVGGTGAVSP